MNETPPSSSSSLPSAASSSAYALPLPLPLRLRLCLRRVAARLSSAAATPHSATRVALRTRRVEAAKQQTKQPHQPTSLATLSSTLSLALGHMDPTPLATADEWSAVSVCIARGSKKEGRGRGGDGTGWEGMPPSTVEWKKRTFHSASLLPSSCSISSLSFAVLCYAVL